MIKIIFPHVNIMLSTRLYSYGFFKGKVMINRLHISINGFVAGPKKPCKSCDLYGFEMKYPLNTNSEPGKYFLSQNSFRDCHYLLCFPKRPMIQPGRLTK